MDFQDQQNVPNVEVPASIEVLKKEGEEGEVVEEVKVAGEEDEVKESPNPGM